MEATSVFKKITAYLDLNGIAYETIHHPAAGSVEEYQKTLGTRLQQQAKALFVRYKKSSVKSFVIVAIPAHKKLDLDALCKLLHAREARLGTHEQLQQATGCSYGELPPLGNIFSLQLLIDQELLREEKIYFNAGSLIFSVVLNPKALVELEKPMLF